MKQKTKIQCPHCGTDVAIASPDFTAVEQPERATRRRAAKTAWERIEALRSAGVDVSELFAMQGANGSECIVSNKDGKLTVLRDDDPLFKHIAEQGTIPNPRLYRRWVMAQMFRMLSHKDYLCKEPVGVTEMIHRLGYEYQWRMLLDELHVQMKMEGRDAENFTDRNRWFNKKVVEQMVQDYVERLKAYVEERPVRKCKGIPYKRIGGRNIFVEDLPSKLSGPLSTAIYNIHCAKNAAQLYTAAKAFDKLRVRLPHKTPQSKAWVDAYKGAGAFYTMQNLIRFHDCTILDYKNKRMDKSRSLAFLTANAEMYRDGNGWRLLGMLKKLLKDNNVNIHKKMLEWRNKKK